MAALRQVLAAGSDVELPVREQALDDLAKCDRAAARETAKRYAKDKEPSLAAAAKVLLRPEPKPKAPTKTATKR